MHQKKTVHTNAKAYQQYPEKLICREKCWDNTVIESVFRNSKTEGLDYLRFIIHEAIVEGRAVPNY